MKSARFHEDWFHSPESDHEVAKEPGWPKPFDSEPAVVESLENAVAAGCDAPASDQDEAHPVPNAHRRWLVRSGALVGAASAVGLLVLIEMFLRTPAMATPPPPPRAVLPAPMTEALSAATLVEATQPTLADAAQVLEPEAAVERSLPELAPKAPASGHARSADHMRVANLQLKGGFFKWAQWNYREAVRLAPADPEAHFGLALAATELRRDRLARAEVAKVLAMDPRHPLARILAGHLEQLGGNSAAARDHYERYLQLEPEGLFAPQVHAILAVFPKTSAGGRP
jgi:hypothetical protein